mgnify:FL=1
MVVVWTPKAKEELKEILVYWKKRNKSNTYSVKLNTEAQKVVKSLIDNPYIWTIEEGYEDVRSVLVFYNYSIFYRVENNIIRILSFWDNRRNPNSLDLFDF